MGPRACDCAGFFLLALIERTKKFSLKIGEDGDERSVVARFATLGVVDLDGDIIEKGALGEQTVLLGAYNHNFQSLPPGFGQTYETRTEAMFRGQFLETTPGEETYRTLKALDEAGFNVEWSFRFFVIEGGFETRKGEEYYVIRKARVTHVAPVESGAGINTGTVEIKSCGPECQANKANQLAGMSKMYGLSPEQTASLPAWVIKSLNSGEQPAGIETPPQATQPIDYEKLAVAVASAMAPLLTSVKAADGADVKATLEVIEKGTLFLANGGGRIDIDTSTSEGRAALTSRLQSGMGLVEAVMAVAEEQGVSVTPIEPKSADAGQNKGEGLGDLIRKLRDEKELTNDDLADAAGLSVASIGGILAGTTDCPSVGQLQRLARRLGASLSSLVQAAENDGCTCYGGSNNDDSNSSSADDDSAKGTDGGNSGVSGSDGTEGTDGATDDNADGGSGQKAAPDDSRTLQSARRYFECGYLPWANAR